MRLNRNVNDLLRKPGWVDGVSRMEGFSTLCDMLHVVLEVLLEIPLIS